MESRDYNPDDKNDVVKAFKRSQLQTRADVHKQFTFRNLEFKEFNNHRSISLSSILSSYEAFLLSSIGASRVHRFKFARHLLEKLRSREREANEVVEFINGQLHVYENSMKGS